MEIPEWIYPGAMCKMKCCSKFEVWKTIEDRIAGFDYMHKVLSFRNLDGSYPYAGPEHPLDLIGPWIEPLELKLPPPSFFREDFDYISADSDGKWHLYEKMPDKSKELNVEDLECFIVLDGNYIELEGIKLPKFPPERWKETLHKADRVNDIWVPVKEEK